MEDFGDYCIEVVQTNPGTTCYVKTVDNEEGKPVFQRWYMCWKACKDGFKSRCRRLIGVDGCHLKTRRGGQLLVAVGIDPNNNIFPIAYGLVEVENKASWEWFLQHLYEDIKGEDENKQDQYEWTFMLDKQKGLFWAFKTVLPNVDHRFCVRCLHENFKRAGFKAHTYKDALRRAATSTTTQYYKEAMENMKLLDVSAYEWLADKDASQWSRAYFNATPKYDVLLNNMCEVFNSFILDTRDKPVLTMMSMVKDLILVYSGITSNQCAVYLKKRQCSSRKWQFSGIPCKHACAAIRLNKENVEDYVHECYTVETYKKVYVHAIRPMAGPELWPQTGRQGPLPPPMLAKKVGRTRRLRRVNPIEAEDNGRTMKCKVRKYLCTICKEHGHNGRACKKNMEQSTQDSMEDHINMEEQSQPEVVQQRVKQQPPGRPVRTRVSQQPPPRAETVGPSIIAPPPIIGTFIPPRAPFRPQ